MTCTLRSKESLSRSWRRGFLALLSVRYLAGDVMLGLLPQCIRLREREMKSTSLSESSCLCFFHLPVVFQTSLTSFVICFIGNCASPTVRRQYFLLRGKGHCINSWLCKHRYDETLDFLDSRVTTSACRFCETIAQGNTEQNSGTLTLLSSATGQQPPKSNYAKEKAEQRREERDNRRRVKRWQHKEHEL